MAEVGDSLKSYTSLNDTIGMIRDVAEPGSQPDVAGQWRDPATVIGQEDVSVAAGTYKGAWKVQVGRPGAAQGIYQWFARGTGMVKQYEDNTNLGYELVYDEELTSATIK